MGFLLSRYRKPGAPGRRMSYVGALLMASVMTVAATSPTFAADPASGAGIVPSVGGASDYGIPAGYADAKAADFESVMAGNSHRIVRPQKGAAGSASQAELQRIVGSASPASLAQTTTSASYPASYNVWFPGIHQKTNYYCLVAVIQSVAWLDVNTSYYLYGRDTLRHAQDRIYAVVKDPILLGSDDPKGLTWINTQFASVKYPFYYLGYTPPTTYMFDAHTQYDNYYFGQPMYVRVDLHSGFYKWYNPLHSDGTHPLHATMATGYNTTNQTDRSYDPFTYTSNGICVATPYNATPDSACTWTINSSNYFWAMDRWDTGDASTWY